MLVPGKPPQNTSVMKTSVTAGAYKDQVWVGPGVPVCRVEARGIHGVVKKNKIVFRRQLTKPSLSALMVLYPQSVYWQLKSPE